MTKRLQLADGLSLPVEAVTQAIGIIAKRRVGKSYTARRFAEQLVKAGQQIVVVDPKGDWWGMRSAADGKSPGLPVVILGGERGDVPLESGSGEIVAKLAAEERVSMILDLSLFRKHEVATFMTSFLETLYRLKAREEFRTPLMLIVDEADAIMPQKPQPNEARMLGAGEDIVRRGGQRGLGCMFITQRSAVLNKNVLTQAEMIIALRTIAPQDLKALDAWIEVHGEREQREVLMTSLPALPIGDAWFWSPGWPTADGIFKRAHVFPIETFDSGATPKAGEKRIEPKNLADVDLRALTKQMAATIEKAKADNPKELRKQIAELTGRIRQIEKAPGSTPAKIVTKSVVDQAAIDRAVAKVLADYRKLLRPIVDQLQRIAIASTNLPRAVGELAVVLSDAKPGVLLAPVDTPAPAVSRPATRLAPPPAPARAATHVMPAEGLSRPQQRILNTLATFELLGKTSANKSNVAVFSDASPTSSSFGNNLGTLRSLAMIDYPVPGEVALTDEGRRLAKAEAAFSTLDELHQAWFAKLSGPQVRLLEQLIPTHPDAIDRTALAEMAGASATSSSYGHNLGTLRSLGLIDYKSGGVFATDLLFPEGLS